jgi:hypothetical protein
MNYRIIFSTYVNTAKAYTRKAHTNGESEQL